MQEYGPFWGMHFFWWAFWILAMIGLFVYNLPERVRVNSLDPLIILKRRLAKGTISEEEYKKITTHLSGSDESVQNDSAHREASSQTTHLSLAGHPIVDGLSFSATWAISYTLCSALYWVAPDVVMTATSKLFHGMSFTQMAQAGTTFGFGDFISVLTLGAVYTFAVGITWSFVHSYFLRQKAERMVRKIEKQTIQKTQLSPLAR